MFTHITMINLLLTSILFRTERQIHALKYYFNIHMYLNAYKTSGLFSSNENKFNIYQNKMNSVQYYCIYFLIIPCISYNVDDNLKSPSLCPINSYFIYLLLIIIPICTPFCLIFLWHRVTRVRNNSIKDYVFFSSEKWLWVLHHKIRR